MSSFPIIQGRSYSSANFLERSSFQDIWKKKKWFSVQSCKVLVPINEVPVKELNSHIGSYIRLSRLMSSGNKKVIHT